MTVPSTATVSLVASEVLTTIGLYPPVTLYDPVSTQLVASQAIINERSFADVNANAASVTPNVVPAATINGLSVWLAVLYVAGAALILICPPVPDVALNCEACPMVHAVVAAPHIFTVVAVALATLHVVVAPQVMSPPTTLRSPVSDVVALAMVVVPVDAPMVNVVAAPPSATVVAVTFATLHVVALPHVMSPPPAEKSPPLMLSAPVSIAPNPVAMLPAFSAPTVVSDDVTTLLASVVPVRVPAAAVVLTGEPPLIPAAAKLAQSTRPRMLQSEKKATRLIISAPLEDDALEGR